MKFKSIFAIFIFFLFFFAIPFVKPTYNFADQLDDLTKQINDLTTQLNSSVNATRPLESQLISMQKQIVQIKTAVAAIEIDVAQKKKIIDDGYKDLQVKQTLLNQTIRDLYIKNSYDSPILIFFSAKSASDLTRSLAYQKAAQNQDKILITNLALSITDLEEKKKALEAEEGRLIGAKNDLDTQSAKLDKIVAGAKAYQATLSSQIAVLSAQQQQLLAAKFASLGIPQSAYTMKGGCSSDLTNGKDPGFSPRFGFFTYGVPNRVGMNQYGALGRAHAGQSYNDILNAYYQNFQITTVGDPTIHVNGTNDYGETIVTDWDLETYVKHVYEMPTDWPAEALKAQAIAARSYTLAFTSNGANAICTDQHCQEVKTELNSQAWIDAVNATTGQVMTSGGQPMKAWFSSTHGGYVYTSADIGWSGTDYTKRAQDASGSVGSFSDLQNNAYDKASPWFYCDWGARSQYGGTAWLKPDEVADIANVIALAQNDGSTKEHLYQLDKPNPAGTDTWDASRVKQELQSRGITPFNSVATIRVNADFSVGKVTTVTVSGDTTQSFPGDFFKTYFDLRAPASIQIVGPLYNVEQK